MKDSACSCKYRRCKYFSYRNVHIRYTVLEIRLPLHIFEIMQVDDKVCLIVAASLDFYPLAGVQSLNDRLLDPLI